MDIYQQLRTNNIPANNIVQESKVINVLRFPLACAVVMIHMMLPKEATENYHLYNLLSTILSANICCIAVPLFFFFSGFLFFQKIEIFTKHVYLAKIKKRIKSLAIPYLFWNLTMLLVLLTVGIIFPEWFSGKEKPVSQYTFTEWIYAFWDTGLIGNHAEHGFPINGPLWFVRNLFILSLCTPLIYIAVKKTPRLTVAIFTIAYLSAYSFFEKLTAEYCIPSIVFFTAGAFFGIHHKTFLLPTRRTSIISLAIAYISLLSSQFIIQKQSEWGG